MASVLQYKTNKRGSRIQQVDTTYKLGMNYVNTPLSEGESKVLVNYDITKEGTLNARKGLQVISEKTTQLNNMYELIDASNIATPDTDVLYQHVIFGAKYKDSFDSIPNTNLRIGTVGGAAFPINTTTATYHSACRAPKAYSMHNMLVEHTPVHYVGCRAFNNAYYYTNPTGSNLNKLGYNLTAYDQETKTPTYTFSNEEIFPKTIAVNEAVNRGYNILLENPYVFNDEFQTTGTDTYEITGILPYSDAECTKLELTPKTGQTIYIKAVIKTTRKDTDSNHYNPVITFEVSHNNGIGFNTIKTYRRADYSKISDMLSIPYTCHSYNSNCIFRVTITWTEASDNTKTTVMITPFDFTPKSDIDAINYDLQNYTLTHAEGMTFWKERLILWGVPEDKSMLFASEVRDPSYFPYPNNVNLFDEPIVNVVPLLDNLIVFTKTKVHILTIDTDYIHLTQKCIQNNLQIADEDIHLTQVVKNMVFFKSGNYYYMIVPKANSLTGELTIAPISKNIEQFLDNFKEELYKILHMVYNYSKQEFNKLVLDRCYNYLDYEDVTNVYLFKTSDNKYINFCLLYNTVQRNWRIYIYETTSHMLPVIHNATGKSLYCMWDKTYKLLQFNSETASDDLGTTFKNYQLYDSGYRDQTVNLKKRYREIQFILNNQSRKNLTVGTGVFIDGGTRTELYNNEVVVKALSDVKYNTSYTGTEQQVELIIEQNLANIVEIPGTTVLGTWELNNSVFPEQTVYKVRFPISGKGYAPRLLFVNKEEKQYEILNTSYVYRTMYSR